MQGGKAGLLGHEQDPQKTGRTITVLADDQFGGAAIDALGVVHLIAIDEQDQVGILLDGAGFTQISQYRALVAALL
ncbi:hypothetical protein D3C84_1100380 [compost metagenome]